MMPVIAAYPNPPRLRALSLVHPSFYILSQSGERPKRYIEFLRLETMPAAARADAWPLAARAQQGERVRCILETLENYPEVTGTSGAGIDLVAYVHSSPARRKPSIISCRSLSRVNPTDSAIHLRETSG